SKFVHRWVINNTRSAHALGRAESGVFNGGGFNWIAAVEKRQDRSNSGDFTLRCGIDFNGPWKCEADVTYCLFRSDGTKWESEKVRVCFHNDYNSSILKGIIGWDNLTHQIFNIAGTFITEFEINVINSERPLTGPSIFAASNRMSNVVLKIKEEKLHVSKEFLAVYSPVFESLFFGDFVEKGKEEVEIKDVVYHEIVDLLNFLYCESSGLTDGTVPHILKLADRFQMERILNLCEKHLKQSSGFDVIKQLFLADQYRLTSLKV
ncbi:hypothetical protein PMAYCL1PPCAC_01484, partial [Pristionchus mayeri]